MSIDPVSLLGGGALPTNLNEHITNARHIIDGLEQGSTSPSISSNPSQWQSAINNVGINASGLTPTSEGSVVSDFVAAVDSKLKEGDALRGSLLRGEAVNLHQVSIALQEAGVAFTLMLEFRNKMMEGYQELMRMQI